jgi:titin
VNLSAVSNDTITTDYLGVSAAGNVAAGNGAYGVELTHGSKHNIVTDDVISGNSKFGVLINGSGTTANLVAADDIGTDSTGSLPLGNYDGVGIYGGANDNTIGGTTSSDRNVISGNNWDGVHIVNSGTTGNVVEGDYIGVTASGSAALGNKASGVAVFDGASNNVIGGSVSGSGNVISANGNRGVYIANPGTTANLVAGNDIGTDSTGSHPLGNHDEGVGIYSGASNNTIGGTTATARNVISGNNWSGIDIANFGTTGNVVEGDYIGVAASGSAALGNGNSGVAVYDDASNNVIGGTVSGSGNVISANSVHCCEHDGVYLSDTWGNVVAGDYIGTDSTGTVGLGNGDYAGAYESSGVVITGGADHNTIGGTTAAARNIISSNQDDGLAIGLGAYDNVVEGNFIGTDVTGTHDLGNNNIGIHLDDAYNNTVGGATTAARNVISANESQGILITTGAGTVVEGNFIGTDVTGAKPLGNDGSGIGVERGSEYNTIGGTTAAEANVLSANGYDGVHIATGVLDNRVEGDFIGTDSTGSNALGNGNDGVQIDTGGFSNSIGGSAAGARNIISANHKDGVEIETGAATNVVQGNFIGTDVTGAKALGNGGNGVAIEYGSNNNVIGGAAKGQANVIAANKGYGVDIDTASAGNLVEGDFIGTDLTGTISLGNGKDGVIIQGDASNNIIGGSKSGDVDLIANNQENGVEFKNAGSGNLVEGDTIEANVANGVLVTNSPGNSVINSTIEQNQGWGILLIGTSVGKTTIKNDVFNNNSLGNVGNN